MTSLRSLAQAVVPGWPPGCCDLTAYIPAARAVAAPGDLLMLAALITVTTAVYLTPTIIAALRESRWTLTIMSLNMFAGWTIAGWLIALVWAVKSGTDKSEEQRPEPDASAPR